MGVKSTIDYCMPLKHFIDKELEMTTADDKGNYIERNMAEIDNASGDEASSFHGKRGQVHMFGGILDLFIAGIVMFHVFKTVF